MTRTSREGESERLHETDILSSTDASSAHGRPTGRKKETVSECLSRRTREQAARLQVMLNYGFVEKARRPPPTRYLSIGSEASRMSIDLIMDGSGRVLTLTSVCVTNILPAPLLDRLNVVEHARARASEACNLSGKLAPSRSSTN